MGTTNPGALAPRKDSNVIEVDGVKYITTAKYEAWFKAYTDPKSDTHNNATQSVIKAYKLDPETQYATACQIAHTNITKHKRIARKILTDNGFTFDKWVLLSAKRAVETDNPIWWVKAGEVAGWYDPQENQAPAPVSNTQNNIFITSEKPRDYNDLFAKFLENGNNKTPSVMNGQETKDEAK